MSPAFHDLTAAAGRSGPGTEDFPGAGPCAPLVGPGAGWLEICVDCMASVEACGEARVPRIELCAGLVEGGTTPSIGFLRRARAAYRGRIMMMIRPRAGDFVVSPAECGVMLDDIQAARDHGADGVVFGCLAPDGTIDLATAGRLVRAAEGLDITFHRAFDVCRELPAALEALIGLGIPRVLTSGGEAGVEAGFESLVALQRQAAGRIALLAGGGLKPEHFDRLRPHGFREFHLSARTSVESPMVYRRPDIPMGAAEVPGEYVRRQADPALLRSLMSLLERPEA
jgi:copper homeostasis protein